MSETKAKLPLARFFWSPDWTPLRGTYIWPLRVFASERPADPNEYLEVVLVLEVRGIDVAITRGGGLFVRRFDRLNASDELVEVLNLLLCELTFRGLQPEPVTISDVQDGRLIGRYAAIAGGVGNYAHKTWGPLSLLTAEPSEMRRDDSCARNEHWVPNFFWTTCDPIVLEDLVGLPSASRLAQFSPTLPALLVAAVSHSARGNVAETVVSNWIITEQILSQLWHEHVERIPNIQEMGKKVPGKPRERLSVSDAERKKRLRDSRTYSASVQAEVLLTAGVLSAEAYAIVQKARKVRNDLAHRASVDRASSQFAIVAMRAMLAQVGLSAQNLPGYSVTTSGTASPGRALEPEFQFRVAATRVAKP